MPKQREPMEVVAAHAPSSPLWAVMVEGDNPEPTEEDIWYLPVTTIVVCKHWEERGDGEPDPRSIYFTTEYVTFSGEGYTLDDDWGGHFSLYDYTDEKPANPELIAYVLQHETAKRKRERDRRAAGV